MAQALEVWGLVADQWQWVSGGMGPPVQTGLRLEAVESAMRITRIPGEDRPFILRQIQVIAGGFLKKLDENEKAKPKGR